MSNQYKERLYKLLNEIIESKGEYDIKIAFFEINHLINLQTVMSEIEKNKSWGISGVEILSWIKQDLESSERRKQPITNIIHDKYMNKDYKIIVEFLRNYEEVER